MASGRALWSGKLVQDRSQGASEEKECKQPEDRPKASPQKAQCTTLTETEKADLLGLKDFMKAQAMRMRMLCH